MRLVRMMTFAICLLAPVAAAADPVADFYAGKQLSFIIRAAPGGNYDLYLRMLARHMMRHIPGNPTAVPMNMPGGGGLTALNYFDKVAPQDGTAITMITQTAPMDQALGLDKNVKVDLGKFNWLGNMSDENLFLVTTRDSKTKTVNDAKAHETLVAATGAGGTEGVMASIMNAALGTRLKNIFGYRSGPEMTLALQRGEAEGRWTTNLRSLFAGWPTGAAGFNVIVQVGLKVDPGYPNVPLLRDLGDASNRTLLDFISQVMALARPVATTAGAPPDRVAALRQAFDATMKDPEFLADAKRQDLNVSPWTGPELRKVIADILSTPKPVRDRIKQAIQSDTSQQR